MNFKTENDEEEEKGEWMLMSKLNTQSITNDAQSSVLAPKFCSILHSESKISE